VAVIDVALIVPTLSRLSTVSVDVVLRPAGRTFVNAIYMTSFLPIYYT